MTLAGEKQTVEKLMELALALPPQARAFVAEQLIGSLDAGPGPAISPEWRAEIRKRCREIDDGLVELQDASDVFERANSALK